MITARQSLFRDDKILIFLIIGFLISNVSCRKIDYRSASLVNKSDVAVVQKFFNTHRTSDAIEKKLVDFVIAQNKKENFIEKTVAQIGYPRWDKILSPTLKKGIKTESDSINVFYLPFVRDSQQYVNASMVITASPSDTSFRFHCDWQYANLQNNVSSHTDTAEHYAIFFMAMDRHVFGYTRFTITDPNLFGSGNTHAREVELSAVQFNSVTTELLEPLEVCETVYNYYTYCTTPNAPTCIITCDECWWCTATLPITYCWTVYVNTGGSTGGTGTTIGGGGTSTPPPPPCTPGPVTPDTNGTVCQPGWTPSTSTPPKDPCDVVAPLTADSLYKAKAMDLKNSTNLNYEKAWVMDTSGTFYYFQGPPGIDQKVNLIVNFPTANVNHSHTNKDLFSIDDLFSAWRFLWANQIHDSVFTLGVSNTLGSYLFTIDNPVEFLNFGNKYFIPEGNDEDIDRFYRGYKIGKANDPAINEKRFLEFVKKFTVGITLLKANADFTGYQKLILNRDGQLVVVPCN